MRYAPDHNTQIREKILDTASALFREHGIHAVGLAKVMASVDLTVGTFYTHFDSKEALVREALLRALRERSDAVAKVIAEGDLELLVRAYLSPEHRDAPGTGCVVAALAPELVRQDASTQRALAPHLVPAGEAFAGAISARTDGRQLTQADTAAILGLLSGTLQIARATPDRRASDAVLEAGVRAALRLLA
jgi:TetR/AcrR family transcriptional repressor of nem operon